MNNLGLEIKVEEIIKNKGAISIFELQKELKDYLKQEIASAISQVVLKNEWRVENIHNRLTITTKSAVNLVDLTTVTVHKKHFVLELKPKSNPETGDWVVTCVDSKCIAKLFFDGKFNLYQVRGAFIKLNKGVLFADVRGCRYKKKQALREARFNNFD